MGRERARERLAKRIDPWGTLESRDADLGLLGRAQLCVSTAAHAFFGVSMLEAAHMGARPVVPDRLAFPEHFAPESRYTHDTELVDRLATLCTRWTANELDLRADRRAITRPYAPARVSARYRERSEALIHGY